ncbi:energy-coupling factor transporter ATP-binding protein EcfA2 [Catenulispora sp. GAS73]|uniref:NACHT domain-containing protein n=1 Tax=Catenulispora sp. GAS73 TaxID=3156269 RepID=UPI003519A010
MRRSLRYSDAVKLLGGGENQLVKLLDDVSATVLLGTGVLDLFEAREQALRLMAKVLDKFGEKLRGVDRLTRTERIHAAHAVIRTTAYFDALGEAIREFLQTEAPQIPAATQAAMTLATGPSSGRRDLYKQLSLTTSAGSPLWDATSVRIFANASADVQKFLAGLAFWDTLDETRRDRLTELVADRVPREAAARYQENLRRLSADCPEFGVWVNLQAHAATREQLAAGLADLEALLAPLAAESAAHHQESLVRAHRAALAKPIIVTDGPESHLAVPSLGEGYIDHSFRLTFTTLPASQSWDDRELRHDLPTVLSSYLMSEYALGLPLLILGQPGSGKSVLTRILAARLPTEYFLPIRVELRRVDAEGDLQDYIESAIREQTGERVQWPRFATADPNLTPVVILDGFDELLQATGVAQTDFLLRIERFQERERDQGRSVAVIVTSRTAVANRATIPTHTPIIRLEPFDDEQIAVWVDIWNRTNEPSLTDRGVRVLSLATVLRYRTLAEQPLLLLMLALYDASDNALSSLDPGISLSTVYEQLLKDFARRELMKDPDVTDLDRRVEQELLRLSIVAFAMFNRGAQWIDAESVTADLGNLNIWKAERSQNTMRSTLTAGQQMIGRFFFIHDVRATRDGEEMQTYEFLHATFSEYLIARLVVLLLDDLAAQHLASTSTYAMSPTINDTLLYSLLSFDALAARAPIVDFLAELTAQRDPAVRDAMAEVVTTLFHNSLMERSDHTYSGYQPVLAEVVTRAASWHANLFLLMVMTRGSISMRAMYPDKGYGAVNQWRRFVNLWRSCVRGEGWNGLADCLTVERTWIGEHQDIVVRFGQPGAVTAEPDMKWPYHFAGSRWQNGGRWDSHSHDAMVGRANFLTDRRLDMAMHNMMPIADALPRLASTLYNTADGRLVTASALMTAALVAPYTSEHADDAILDLANALPDVPSNLPLNETFAFNALCLGLFVNAVELDRVSADTRRRLRALALEMHEKWIGSFRIRKLYNRLAALEAKEPAPPTPATSPPSEPSPATSSPETPATPPDAP